MPATPAPSARFPAACLAVFTVCGAGFSVLQSELAARAALEPDWVDTCTRVGMGGFLTGAWLSVLFLRGKPLHAVLSGLFLGGLALGITGLSLAATIALFAIAVGFAEVCLTRELLHRRVLAGTSNLLLAHAGWPVGLLLGTLLTTGMPADSLSLHLAFLLLNAVGALWMLRRTLPAEESWATESVPADVARVPLPLLVPLALLVGGIEFAAEARLLASTPAGWAARAFALLTILMAVTRLGLALWCQNRPGVVGTLLGAGAAICLLATIALPDNAPPFVFLASLVAFALGKAALWPGMLVMGAYGNPRHVRFIIPAMVSLGVLAPGLLALLRG